MFIQINSIYTTRILTLLAASFLFILSACSSDDDPEPVNDEEEINRVTLTVTGGGNTQTLTWNEGDSDYPSVNLSANTSYQVAISFFDASDPTEVENITEEVIEEADEHHVFFAVAGIDGLTIASRSGDTIDSDGNPVNLQTTWTTTSSGSGTVRATLIHEPQTKTGTTRNDFGGETDVELDYPVSIQ